MKRDSVRYRCLLALLVPCVLGFQAHRLNTLAFHHRMSSLREQPPREGQTNPLVTMEAPVVPQSQESKLPAATNNEATSTAGNHDSSLANANDDNDNKKDPKQMMQQIKDAGLAGE